MRRGKRLLVVLLAVCLMAALSVTVLAAGASYTYTIRIFSGARGTFRAGPGVSADGTVKTISGVGYRYAISTADFNTDMIAVNDARYYAKGIRESGRDNDTVGILRPVTRDIDYVVAYGIRGEEVRGTITYTDAAGNVLAEENYLYGNVGDRPVVNYLYIDGYQPQAYNLTRTLTADPAQNVFPFVYTRIPAPTPTPAPNNANQNQPANQGGGANNAGNANNAAGQNTGENGASPEPGETLPPEEVRPAEPEDILDLDVPLAGPDGSGASSGIAPRDDESGAVNLSKGAVLGISAGGIIIIGLVLWILLFLRKRKREDEE